ncbi:MAG: zinc ribbon domain-containing protein, partial [Ruthenibacterium sp.]
RTQPHSNIPLNSKGKSLLVGNIFCAHCGNRLTLTSSGKRIKRENGEIKYEPRIRYQCHYNVRHPGECDGQSGYGVTKLDAVVEKVIRMKFAEITAASESEILENQHEREIELARIRLDATKARLKKKKMTLRITKLKPSRSFEEQAS